MFGDWIGKWGVGISFVQRCALVHVTSRFYHLNGSIILSLNGQPLTLDKFIKELVESAPCLSNVQFVTWINLVSVSWLIGSNRTSLLLKFKLVSSKMHLSNGSIILHKWGGKLLLTNSFGGNLQPFYDAIKQFMRQDLSMFSAPRRSLVLSAWLNKTK